MPRLLATVIFSLVGSAHTLSITARAANPLSSGILTGITELDQAKGLTKDFLTTCTALDDVTSSKCRDAPGKISTLLDNAKNLFAQTMQRINDATPATFKANSGGVVDAFDKYVDTARDLAPYLNQLGCQPVGTVDAGGKFKTALQDQVDGAESVVDAFELKAKATNNNVALIAGLREEQDDFSNSNGDVKDHFGPTNVDACDHIVS